MSHKGLLTSTVFLASSLMVQACGGPSPASALQITNGMDVKESAYPSVVKIRAFGGGALQGCTGTFVTHYQVVTAAHCLEGLEPDDPSIFAAKFDADGQEITSFGADAFQVHPLYRPGEKMSPHDVAVVNFPRHAASRISLIASQRAPLNVWVQLVGYGDNENFYDEQGQLSGSGNGKKRVGTNKLLAYEGDFIRIEGVPGKTPGVNPGLQSCSGMGDSGGPLYYNSSTLIGISYGGGLLTQTADDGTTSTRCVSYYTDLNTKENIDFLESTLDYGNASEE